MTKIRSYKSITAILLAVFFFSPFLALEAEAQWVVWDPGNFVPNSITAVNTSVLTSAEVGKEFGLDTVAWVLVNLIIERLAASTVNWINSGFKGAPAFVTDPEDYFLDIGDKVAGQFIFKNPKLNFLCGPIQAKVRLALQQNYIEDRRWQCTLSQVSGNVNNFIDDFSQGGWDEFFELSQRQQNNPLGAYLQAQDELNIQIATRQGTKKKELDWGRGFLSWEECENVPGSSVSVPASTPGAPPITVQTGNTKACHTNTPGSVIETKLNDVLKIGNDKLATADEINEIVSALLNQLVSQVVGGIGRGLRGLSQSSSGNSSFSERLASTTIEGTVDYFGNKVDNTFVNQLQNAVPPNLDAAVPINPIYPPSSGGQTVGSPFETQ